MNMKHVYQPFEEFPTGLTSATIEPSTEIPEVVPVSDTRVEVDERSTFGLVELLLKDPERVDDLNRDEARQPEMIPRFLAIALASFALFSLAMIVLLNTAPKAALPRSILPVPSASWEDGSALGLLLAYTLGLVAASGVCLPSFYFYGLLSGVRISMLHVTGEIMKGKAASAIMLLGLLPIYVAVVLGMIVFGAPPASLELWLYLGLILPFLAGFWGIRSIYRGVMGLADTLPPERRCRRECFLRRLTLSWAACYAAVSPVMIYRLWEFFAA
jgi:hypothetical protein